MLSQRVILYQTSLQDCYQSIAQQVKYNLMVITDFSFYWLHALANHGTRLAAQSADHVLHTLAAALNNAMTHLAATNTASFSCGSQAAWMTGKLYKRRSLTTNPDMQIAADLQ